MILPKDFLSIEDLADYLNKLGWSYDLSVSRDHYKLHKDIYDLIIQGKINLVFHYTGHIKESICDNDIDEVTGKLKNCTSKTLYTSAYFIIHPALARAMLLDNKITTIQGGFNLYSFQNGKKNPDVTHTFYLYDILDGSEQSITANDLYIPKLELDKLFQGDTQNDDDKTINELNQRIKQLEQQLEQSRQQSEIPNAKYTTDAMEALNAVVDKYWLDYDPKQKNATKQHTIKEFVKENYPMITDSMALWIDKIARHPSAK